jgi:isopenicillin N synthase-like dioxygenase
MEEYHAAMEEVAHRVTRLLLASVGLPPTYLHEDLNAFSPQASAVTRLLHYSPVVSRVEEGVFGCGSHTDWGVLTLLLTEEEGLEVLCPREEGKGGREWLRVPPCRGMKDGDTEGGRDKEVTEEEKWLLICNLGDLLQRWTNDCLQSTPHRVVNREGKERYSIPFFFTANPAAVVECLPPFLEEEKEEEGEEGREGGRRRKAGNYPPIVVSEYIAQKYRSVTVGPGETGKEEANGGEKGGGEERK